MMTSPPLDWLVAADEPLPAEGVDSPRPTRYGLARRRGLVLLGLIAAFLAVCLVGPLAAIVLAFFALVVAALVKVVAR